MSAETDNDILRISRVPGTPLFGQVMDTMEPVLYGTENSMYRRGRCRRHQRYLSEEHDHPILIICLSDPSVRLLPVESESEEGEPYVLPAVNEYSGQLKEMFDDLADTILNGTPLRPSAERAYHVHESERRWSMGNMSIRKRH